MRILTRSRLVTAALVLGFVAVLAGLGAISRSSEVGATPAAATAVPYVPWYWTMIVSPTDEDVLLLATNKGLYRSTDGGRSWKPTGPKNLHATSLVQAGDTVVAGGLRAGPKADPNPIVRKGKGRTAPDGPAVLATSGDDGKTWQELKPRGLPSTTVQALAVDPADSTALYALLNDGKLYRSNDVGRSFELVTPKIGIAPWAITIAKDGRFISGDMDAGSFVSTNAKRWQHTPFKDSEGKQMVMEYAVQPTDTSRVLMSSMGIVMSTDGGKTWRIVLRSKEMFGPIAWAPSSPDVAYAVGFERTLWRSDDGGKSWKKVP
jgi:photosystem II stability/assembly factor-like uncharacterized protein